MLPLQDKELVQIVDRALADAALRGGPWLACRPGCTPCCHGVFRISQLDALRLQTALDALRLEDPQRAAAVTMRAEALVATLSAEFPGDATTGRLDEQHTPEQEAAWEGFSDLPAADTACAALDPASGRCELYDGRPLTCRIFGPPVQNEGGIGVCELCYTGATEAQVLAGEMHLAHQELEEELDQQLAASGRTGETLIAWALRP
ncbi:YkgJ family cysteine cluster protein [Acidipila sp. EB88]|uniref:YkgJ family cysteine cluster protein n=1 Tax=Acidipila sp. EB88 TaxID=2305226 RepID=UPI000F602C18|nr:YkgJ family cysteine cluster protein [Acidipila sp. EB88]RRA47311.1 YkgJ family cysteine cluster protein [Acidipila sp. EB88]